MPTTRFYVSETSPGQRTAYQIYENKSKNGSRHPIPLVLVQGMSAVGTVDWPDLANELCKKRTVVVFDNRDIGESTWSSDDKTISLYDLAQDALNLIQHLSYKEIDILGHSMGGKNHFQGQRIINRFNTAAWQA